MVPLGRLSINFPNIFQIHMYPKLILYLLKEDCRFRARGLEFEVWDFRLEFEI